MTWWISKLLNWPGNSGGTYHNYHQNYVHKKEPTRHEINELNTMIDRFGSNINVKEFEEHILNYTKKISDLYNFDEIMDIDKLAISAYDNYLARLYQTIKYINQNANASRHQADIYLKFDTINVVEFYPLLNSLLIFGEECTIGRRCNHQEKRELNNTIHTAIYTYAKEILPQIKQQDKINKKENGTVQKEQKENEQKEKEQKEKEQREKLCQQIVNKAVTSRPRKLDEILTTTGDYNINHNTYYSNLGDDMSYETNMKLDTERRELEEFLDEQLNDNYVVKPESFNTHYQKHKCEEELDPLLHTYTVDNDDDNAVEYDIEMEDFNPHYPFDENEMINGYY